MSLNDMCRLCAQPVGRSCIAVFGVDGIKVNLEHKLRICSPVTVRESDSFPKQVCLDCLIEVDKVYEFHQKVRGAQLSLKAIEQSRKRQLSETEEGNSRKRIQFGSTTLSNLTKSFADYNQSKDIDSTLPIEAKKCPPPLSVSVNSDTSSENAHGYVPDEPQGGIAEKSTPVKTTPRKSPTQKAPGPLRNLRKLKTEPESPMKNPVSSNSVQARTSSVSPTLSNEKNARSDAPVFKTCKFCERKFLLKDFHQHEALHKGGSVFICDQCNKSFFTLLAYNRHVERHLSNKPMNDAK